jgi:hypothetical protein
MMYCAQCQAEYPDEFKFWSKCASPLVAKPASPALVSSAAPPVSAPAAR